VQAQLRSLGGGREGGREAWALRMKWGTGHLSSLPPSFPPCPPSLPTFHSSKLWKTSGTAHR
jgi:hypothetical protein